MSTYTVQFHDHFNPPPAPVSEPLPGREADMVVNNAGAYTFSLGHTTALLRRSSGTASRGRLWSLMIVAMASSDRSGNWAWQYAAMIFM